jgi:hypothetical protein
MNTSKIKMRSDIQNKGTVISVYTDTADVKN